MHFKLGHAIPTFSHPFLSLAIAFHLSKPSGAQTEARLPNFDPENPLKIPWIAGYLLTGPEAPDDPTPMGPMDFPLSVQNKSTPTKRFEMGLGQWTLVLLCLFRCLKVLLD
jgi:hypothetical protein